MARPLTRQQKQDQLKQQCWDMVIVGGGITGAGTAREASRRGLKVLLLEQQDFAWGTSSRSSKMVHGGLRYLAMGDTQLTRHSLQERERLLAEAPGLVERMGYYFLLKKSWLPWRLVMKIILSIYDTMADIKDHHLSSNEELKQQFTQLKTTGLNGAAYYTDAVTDDTRLVVRVLQEAEADGCCLLNYSRVSRCERRDDGVNYITVKDQLTQLESEICAKVVVNSTGAWADELRSERIDEARVRPLKGSHLVLAQGVLPISCAITCSHPEDGRSVFVFPWEGRSVIGTTDLDYTHDLSVEPSVSAEEVSYLLAIVNQHFPSANVGESDVVASFAGVRPVISSEKNHSKRNAGQDSEASAATKKPSKERRDHAVWDNDGLITASGGKLTTFRLMALDVLKQAEPYLPGFNCILDQAPVFRPSPLLDKPNCDIQRKRLRGCYGFRVNDFMAATDEQQLEKIPGSEVCLAELQWALNNEWVEHLDDLMLRRTRLGLLLPAGGEHLLPQLKSMCLQAKAWSESDWQQEVTRYLSIWKNHYSLPVS